LVLESIFLPEEFEFRARSNHFGEEPIHTEQSCCFTSDAKILRHMHEPFHENDKRVTICVSVGLALACAVMVGTYGLVK